MLFATVKSLKLSPQAVCGEKCPRQLEEKGLKDRVISYNPDEVQARLYALSQTWEQWMVLLDVVRCMLEGSRKKVGKAIEEHNYIVPNRFEISCC